MLSTISVEQFDEWKGFYQLEPWGEEWMQTGFICASIFTAMTGEEFNPKRFLPVQQPEAGDPIAAALYKLAAIHGTK